MLTCPPVFLLAFNLFLKYKSIAMGKFMMTVTSSIGISPYMNV